MASGRKQKRTTNNLMMMRPGLRAQIPDSPSLSLSSHGQHYLNAGYENTENLSEGQYEDLELYNQIPACPRKFNNAIYEQSTPTTIPPEIKIERPERQRQFTECSDDSTSILMHSRSKKSRCTTFLNVFTAIMSLVSLALVLLLAFGIMKTGGDCGCDMKSAYTQQHLTKINQASSVSTSVLVEMIKRLERNVTSMLAREAVYRREIVELKSEFEGLREKPTEEPSTDYDFKLNITTEVKQLREKQVQLHSSLTKLKKSDETKRTDIQEMSAKVVGLAVAVNFLSLNDSLIKLKVHKLSQSEVEFRSSIEALKQKDAAVDATLKRAKDVEAFLNSSVSQLKSMDGLMKNKLDQLNSSFMSKINGINSTVNKMKGGAGQPGPPGPPGPRGIPGAPGAGNLTQCQHQQETFEGTAGSTANYDVIYVEPKDKIVVGATCSTIRGDETNMSTGTNKKGQTVYLCQCKGMSNVHKDSGKLKCIIDVWVCPRRS